MSKKYFHRDDILLFDPEDGLHRRIFDGAAIAECSGRRAAADRLIALANKWLAHEAFFVAAKVAIRQHEKWREVVSESHRNIQPGSALDGWFREALAALPPEPAEPEPSNAELREQTGKMMTACEGVLGVLNKIQEGGK